MPYLRYYPVFLKIEGEKCVVIGGGGVAERKARALLDAGGRVTVISPVLTRRLEKEKQAGKITHVARRYRKGDLKGAFVVIAATDSEEENIKVSEETKARGPKDNKRRLKNTMETDEKGARGPIVNVVDRPELCSFIVPSVVRRGPLQIAISTSGASPATAKAIRKELEKLYGPEFGRHLRRLAKLRAKAFKEIKDKRERSRYLKGPRLTMRAAKCHDK